MIELHSSSPDNTRAIAATVAAIARGGDLIILVGQMGAGKTAFAQGFAKALGIDEPITSPTYTLVHTYATGSSTSARALHHADLYRLEHTAEVDDLALAELLDDRSIMLVEWGDVVDLGPHLRIELRIDDSQLEAVGADDLDGREITLESTGRGWASRWAILEGALEQWSVS